jgi:FkbM family methyltransferase
LGNGGRVSHAPDDGEEAIRVAGTALRYAFCQYSVHRWTKRTGKTSLTSEFASRSSVRLREAFAAQGVAWLELLRDTWTNPGNRGRRGRALGAIFTGELRSRLGRGPVEADLGDRSRVAVDPRLAGHRLLGARLPDHGELRFLQSVLRPGDRFFDVGANIGVYSLVAAERGAQVMAFEPQPEVADLLERNVAGNGVGDLVEVHRVAVGATSGTVRFTAGIGLVGHCIPDDDALASSRQGFYTGRSSELISVPMTTIDAVAGSGRVTALKIDVEGFEFDVLLGARELLVRRRVGYVQFERRELAHRRRDERGDPASFLRSLGATLHHVDESGALVPYRETADRHDVVAIVSHDLVAARLG